MANGCVPRRTMAAGGNPPMIRFVLNGVSRDGEAGASLLHAIRAAGIPLPAMCHDDRLVHPARAACAWSTSTARRSR